MKHKTTETFNISNPDLRNLIGKAPYSKQQDIHVEAVFYRYLSTDHEGNLIAEYEADLNHVIYQGVNVLPFLSSGELTKDLWQAIKDLAVAHAPTVDYPCKEGQLGIEVTDGIALITLGDLIEEELPEEWLTKQFAKIDGFTYTNGRVNDLNWSNHEDREYITTIEEFIALPFLASLLINLYVDFKTNESCQKIAA